MSPVNNDPSSGTAGGGMPLTRKELRARERFLATQNHNVVPVPEATPGEDSLSVETEAELPRPVPAVPAPRVPEAPPASAAPPAANPPAAAAPPAAPAAPPVPAQKPVAELQNERGNVEHDDVVHAPVTPKQPLRPKNTHRTMSLHRTTSLRRTMSLRSTMSLRRTMSLDRSTMTGSTTPMPGMVKGNWSTLSIPRYPSKPMSTPSMTRTTA